jgi:hypothetical protein
MTGNENHSTAARNRRVLLGFIIAPAMASSILMSTHALSWCFSRNKPNWHGRIDIVQDVASGLLIYGLASGLVSVVLGLPLWLVYRHVGWHSLRSFLLGGLGNWSLDPAVSWNIGYSDVSGRRLSDSLTPRAYLRNRRRRCSRRILELR